MANASSVHQSHLVTALLSSEISCHPLSFILFVNKDAFFPHWLTLQEIHFLFQSWRAKPNHWQTPGFKKAAHLPVNVLRDTPFKYCLSGSALCFPLMFELQPPNLLRFSQNPVCPQIQNKGLWSRYKRNILLSRHRTVSYLMAITTLQLSVSKQCNTPHCIPRAKTTPLVIWAVFVIYAV